MTAVMQFQAAMVGAGLTPPADIYADSLLHRFGDGGKPSWYVLHLDGVPAGSFGNWRTGLTETWCAKSRSDMTDSERQATWQRIQTAQRQRDADKAQHYAAAAAAAQQRWAAAAPATDDHPYLVRKAIEAHGVRVDDCFLLVPMRDTSGTLHSLQSIAPNGEKRFMTGGRVAGMYFSMGKPTTRITLVEGLATGATIHEIAGEAVAVAFASGNLLPVAMALRAKYPTLEIVIAADDDWQTPGNPGLTAGKTAAAAVGAKLAVPNFNGMVRGIKDTDFNDMARCIREQGTNS